MGIEYFKSELKQSKTFCFRVADKAKVIYAPQEVFLAHGKPAILDCHFRANPPLTNLRWEKDGFLYDPYNVPGVFYKRNGSLYFSNVDETHNGYYSCTPYNKLGTEGSSPNIHVIVQTIPVFLIKPHSVYLRKLGETLEVPCDAKDGINGHKPIIIWYRVSSIYRNVTMVPDTIILLSFQNVGVSLKARTE